MTSVIRLDRLPCGISACIQTSRESPLLGISVWINTGAAQDPAGKDGLAHLCEHLLLRPLTYPGSRPQQILLKTGALINAYTDAEWLVISAQAPVNQAKSLINLLAALVCDPYCKPEGMEMEKAAILQELRNSQPVVSEQLASLFKQSAFAPKPCGESVGGTPATLDAIKLDDVHKFYSRYLNVSNMMITAHGDINSGDLTVMLDQAFKEIPKTPLLPSSTESESAMTAMLAPEYRPVRICEEVSGNDSISGYEVLAGIGSVTRKTEEYWTALAFEVLMADGSGSLLSHWLRNECHWNYGVVSMTEAYSTWGNQYFLMDIAHGQIDEVIEYLGQQWQMMPDMLTDEKVQALSNRFLNRALSSLSGLQDRMILMRDTVLTTSEESVTLEGGLEAIVTRHARQLSPDKLLSYIRQYAEWDRVSLVCAPVY